MNLDLISQIHRYGRRHRGGTIGLRINPRVSAARPESGISYYSGDAPTKFGIYPERLDEAIAVARAYDLTIDTIHFHVSHHLLDDDLPAFERAVAAAAAMARRALDAGCPLREVNAGGGLAAVMQQGQRPLDLDAYAGILAEHLGPLGVTIACEPGEMFCKNAAVLLAEVVTVEDRSRAGDGSAVFAGLTCGWNVMHLAFIYKELVETVLCRAADAPRTASYTLTSHINEGPDIFAEDYPLPPLEEGDIVALLGVGAYCQANWHPHCLRPFPRCCGSRNVTRPEERGHGHAATQREGLPSEPRDAGTAADGRRRPPLPVRRSAPRSRRRAQLEGAPREARHQQRGAHRHHRARGRRDPDRPPGHRRHLTGDGLVTRGSARPPGSRVPPSSRRAAASVISMRSTHLTLL